MARVSPADQLRYRYYSGFEPGLEAEPDKGLHVAGIGHDDEIYGRRNRPGVYEDFNRIRSLLMSIRTGKKWAIFAMVASPFGLSCLYIGFPVMLGLGLRYWFVDIRKWREEIWSIETYLAGSGDKALAKAVKEIWRAEGRFAEADRL